MLKIRIKESVNEIRFVVYGKLFEPWVSSLKALLREIQRHRGNRKIVIDLRKLTALDPCGLELLSMMSRTGAKLLVSGAPMTYYLM